MSDFTKGLQRAAPWFAMANAQMRGDDQGLAIASRMQQSQAAQASQDERFAQKMKAANAARKAAAGRAASSRDRADARQAENTRRWKAMFDQRSVARDQAQSNWQATHDATNAYRKSQLEAGPKLPWYVGKAPDGSLTVHPEKIRLTEAGVNKPPEDEKGFDKKSGALYAIELHDARKQSAKARSELHSLGQIKSALADPNLYTGTGAKSIHSAKKALQSLFGVPVKGVGSGELVNHASTKLALSFKGMLPGTLSNSDITLLRSLPPGISKTPEGNRLIAETAILARQYQIAKAQATVNYAADHGGRIDGGRKYNDYLQNLEREWGQKMAESVAKLRAQGEAPVRSPLAGIPTIKSARDFMALPSGARHTVEGDPTIRIKP